RLAVVDVGRDDRPCRRLPRIVGTDDLFAPVGVANDDLRQQRGPLAVRIATCLPRESTAIPSVAERCADGVRAAPKERGDVVRLVLQPRVITRPARREDLVADALAIDL